MRKTKCSYVFTFVLFSQRTMLQRNSDLKTSCTVRGNETIP